MVEINNILAGLMSITPSQRIVGWLGKSSYYSSFSFSCGCAESFDYGCAELMGR